MTKARAVDTHLFIIFARRPGLIRADRTITTKTDPDASRPFRIPQPDLHRHTGHMPGRTHHIRARQVDQGFPRDEHIPGHLRDICPDAGGGRAPYEADEQADKHLRGRGCDSPGRHIPARDQAFPDEARSGGPRCSAGQQAVRRQGKGDGQDFGERDNRGLQQDVRRQDRSPHRDSAQGELGAHSRNRGQD